MRVSSLLVSHTQRTMLGLLEDAGADGLTLGEWNSRARAAGLGAYFRSATLCETRKVLQLKGLVERRGDAWHAVVDPPSVRTGHRVLRLRRPRDDERCPTTCGTSVLV